LLTVQTLDVHARPKKFHWTKLHILLHIPTHSQFSLSKHHSLITELQGYLSGHQQPQYDKQATFQYNVGERWTILELNNINHVSSSLHRAFHRII